MAIKCLHNSSVASREGNKSKKWPQVVKYFIELILSSLLYMYMKMTKHTVRENVCMLISFSESVT